MKISAIIITSNEENNINDCLETVKWADEIIIVDSNSTDNTQQIAKKYTDKIFSVDINNVTEKRKFSIDKAGNDWILFIDADERITPELRDEITALDPGTGINGYYINRKNFYLGRWIKHCGIYPDFHIRLFNRTNAEVSDRIVHEGIEVKGTAEKLNNHILHYSVPDFEQMFKKINYYSTLEALEHFNNKKDISKSGAFIHALSAFLRLYISRKGYKDGIYGFYVSIMDSLVNFLTHLKLLKLQNKI